MKAEDPPEAAARQAAGPAPVSYQESPNQESSYPNLQNQELAARQSQTAPAQPLETRLLKWIVWGPHGLRAGWSILLFLAVTVLAAVVVETAAALLGFHVNRVGADNFTASRMALGELAQVLAILGAAAVCALVERRSILDYNLAGPRRAIRFLWGALSGAAALSLLVGVLGLAGWVRFGAISVSGGTLLLDAALWAVAFLGTGLAEEGLMRCYLLATLARGLNLGWALGTIAVVCLSSAAFVHNQDIWGVYLLAGLGLIPCLLLHASKSSSAGFWQAAWVTSTLFGFIHTPNGGETWLGIFQAGAIGFIFCVSVRLTGSAWWAIGFHAAWDWAQTFFYGAADSGFQPQGHFLTTLPAASSWKSGGTAGLEGSVASIPLQLLVLAALLLIYRRKPAMDESASALPPAQLS